MGFLSFSIGFYRDELKKLKSRPVTESGIYRARQLLRMLDDLADEGYNELGDLIENEFSGVSMLRGYLRKNGAEPFGMPGNLPDAGRLTYSERETELMSAVVQAVGAAGEVTDTAVHPFAARLREFCRWIGYEPGTAYIFLLRDTLLPFVHYLGQGRENIYPWLLGRKAFAELAGKRNADDEIRASVYRALESGCTDWQSFAGSVLPDMKKTAAAYPRAEKALRTMLESIGAEKIIVVESGCAGTFPLLLAALDSRVDMRMYTTYPYLTGIYGGRIFTPRYEENRMAETMVSQELYFRFSGIRDGRFYVRECTDAEIRRQSLCEIKAMPDQCTGRAGMPERTVMSDGGTAI